MATVRGDNNVTPFLACTAGKFSIVNLFIASDQSISERHQFNQHQRHHSNNITMASPSNPPQAVTPSVAFEIPVEKKVSWLPY